MSIEDLEKLRKDAVNIERVLILIVVIINVIGGIINYYPFIFHIIIMLFGIAFIKLFSRTTPQAKKFILSYKNFFVLNSLHSIFSDVVYKPKEGLDKSLVKEANILGNWDIYSSNDFISGKYKNVKFVQADVAIQRSSNDDITTLFWGKWMIFEFNKTFKDNLQVIENKFYQYNLSNKSNYQKIILEDEEFNKLFLTYAKDENDAFYILTPNLMRKIKELNNKIYGHLLFSFIDNKLHIGIHNYQDYFEPDIYKEINEEKIRNDISKDIKLITDFVDELNLDNNLFKNKI